VPLPAALPAPQLLQTPAAPLQRDWLLLVGERLLAEADAPGSTSQLNQRRARYEAALSQVQQACSACHSHESVLSLFFCSRALLATGSAND
jgi:hypothetical protein